MSRHEYQPRWYREGSTWHCLACPGWAIRDTGRKGRRDRYVIVRPDGTENDHWHQAHQDKKHPGLREAMWSAEAHARSGPGKAQEG